MLLILRQLRRSFFQPGKLRTYVAYAVGEILLIVIGILIAVQIGDWKEEAKMSRQRDALIENLSKDFQANLERVEESLSVAEAGNKSLREFLNISAIDNSHLTVSELRTLSGDGIVAITFQPALGTYRSADSNGSISLLNRPELIELFIDFEQSFSYYLINQDADREATLSGESMFISRHLGSMSVLYDDYGISPPEPYILSDSDYRKFIAQKDVHAYFELIYKVQINQQSRLRDLKETTLEILAVLNDL